MNRTSIREKVLSLIRRDGPKDRKELIELLHLEVSEVHGVLGPVVRDKLLEREAEGPNGVIYRLTSKGRDYCQKVYGDLAQEPTGDVPQTSGVSDKSESSPDPMQKLIATWEHCPVAEADEDQKEIEVGDVQDAPATTITEVIFAGPDDYVAFFDDVTGRRAVVIAARASLIDEAVELARKTDRPVSVYRLQLIGEAVQDVVFKPVR